MPMSVEAVLPELAVPQTAVEPEAPSRHAFAVYLVWLVLVPVTLFAAALTIVPTRWFESHSHNEFSMNVGYGETLHNADCNILVYGDSTALLAVDPLVLQKETGLSACNISEFMGMTLVNGTMVVDRFLAHNPRPRYLLFVYAPEGYVRQKDWGAFTTFEAISFRLEHVRNLSTVWLFLRHPAEFFSWMETGLYYAIVQARSPAAPEASRHLREPHRGHYPWGGANLTSCPASTLPEGQPDAAWIATLRTKYGVEGTRVLVDATPMPACDPTFAFYKDKFGGLSDNRLETYPISDYLAAGHSHMNAAGSLKLSTQLGRQIAALEQAH